VSAADVSDPLNRRRPRTEPAAPAPASAATPAAKPKPAAEPRPIVPTLLDFYPFEDAKFTELHAFFDHLRQGRFTTTRCRSDGTLLWPPRTACPKCHGADLEWVDLPTRGRIYAFSAVLAGAPLGMESDVPFAVGLVDLEGTALRLFGRIVGRPWNELKIGEEVEVTPFDLPDGRVFYRFRAMAPG
jgi:uncharacterized OB-fold protein